MMKPKYYTSYEGGMWFIWPGYLKVNESDLEVNGGPSTIIGGRRVHAILFDGNIIWDCIRGWTGKINHEIVVGLGPR